MTAESFDMRGLVCYLIYLVEHNDGGLYKRINIPTFYYLRQSKEIILELLFGAKGEETTQTRDQMLTPEKFKVISHRPQIITIEKCSTKHMATGIENTTFSLSSLVACWRYSHQTQQAAASAKVMLLMSTLSNLKVTLVDKVKVVVTSCRFTKRHLAAVVSMKNAATMYSSLIMLFWSWSWYMTPKRDKPISRSKSCSSAACLRKSTPAITVRSRLGKLAPTVQRNHAH